MTDRIQTIREQLRHLGPERGAAGEEALDSVEADMAAAREALEEIGAIEWVEEVDVNGEYVTERWRPSSVVKCEIDAALARLSAGKDDEAASEDPTAGLPADLVSALRDPNVVVPQDAALFDLLAKWKNAPSDTASAETPEGEGR